METNEANIPDQSSDFPEQVLIDILLKLPPKSIFRVRCVSKHWLSLISDPSFLPSYVSRSKGSHPFTLVFHMHSHISTWSNFRSFTSYSPFPSDQIQGLEVEATCNDLILCPLNLHDLPVCFAANPLTTQTVILPMHVRKTSRHGYMGLIARVENGITNYSVIFLSRNYDKDSKLLSLSIDAFSSLEGEWREFRLRNSRFNVEVDKRPCIAFRGAIHWICNKMKTVLAYNPCISNPDQCRFISVPNEAYIMNGTNAILGVSCDNLYYFEMSRISIEEFKLAGWKLWVMRDYDKGVWSLDKEVNERRVYEPLTIFGNLLSTHSPLFPLSFHPWDNDIVYFWYEGYILSFNVEEGWFEDTYSRLSSESMVSMSEIFSLLMPLCPTQLPQPQWKWKNCSNGG